VNFRKPLRNTTPLTADEILAKMEHFCAYQERCSKEVLQKLAELGALPEDKAQILQVLSGDGFYDDARFAHAYAGGKFRIKHWGRNRIRIELRMRDLPANLIESALESIPEADYLKVLEELVDKKKVQYEGDPQIREKIINALMRVGFEFDLIFRYL
jgi:regulatory protein